MRIEHHGSDIRSHERDVHSARDGTSRYVSMDVHAINWEGAGRADSRPFFCSATKNHLVRIA
jgi:hypothetical protein